MVIDLTEARLRRGKTAVSPALLRRRRSELREIAAQVDLQIETFKGLAAKARGLGGKRKEHQQGSAEEDLKAALQAAQTDMDGLKGEWAGAYLQNLEYARRAARAARHTIGMTEDTINLFESAIGPAKTLKFFAALGQLMSEGGWVDGDTRIPPPNNLLQRWYPNG